MTLIFKNKKVEYWGLLTWTIFTVSAMNLTFAYTHTWIFSLAITQPLCSLLFIWTAFVYHEFKLTITAAAVQLLCFGALVQIFQFLFNVLFVLADERLAYWFYVVSFFWLLFTAFVFSLFIKLVTSDKK